jgi:hypothetical protein
MTYEIVKTLEEYTDEKQHGVVMIVKVNSPHVSLDFSDKAFHDITTFRFESGWVQVDENTKLEITRLLASCSEDHDHGVYYQAPREMPLWEAMFNIGEISADGLIPETEETETKDTK